MLEQQCGKTSRTIHFLTYPQITQLHTTKTCNEPCFACVRLAGLHGVRDWLKLLSLVAFQLSLQMTLCYLLRMQFHGKKLGFFVDEKDVPNLDTILTSIPPEVILRKQRLLANPSMKQAMLFPQPAQPGDAFHQVLNGLARKLPHEKTIYLRPGEKILNWTAGPVGDLKPW